MFIESGNLLRQHTLDRLQVGEVPADEMREYILNRPGAEENMVLLFFRKICGFP
jgi:hypothetical protein